MYFCIYFLPPPQESPMISYQFFHCCFLSTGSSVDIETWLGVSVHFLTSTESYIPSSLCPPSKPNLFYKNCLNLSSFPLLHHLSSGSITSWSCFPWGLSPGLHDDSASGFPPTSLFVLILQTPLAAFSLMSFSLAVLSTSMISSTIFRPIKSLFLLLSPLLGGTSQLTTCRVTT